MRDLVHWLRDPDALVDRAALIPAGAELAEARTRDEASFRLMTDEIDLSFDEIAAEIRGLGGRRAVFSVPQRLAELTERVSVLEMAYNGLQARMAQERLAFGRRSLDLEARQPIPRPPAQIQRFDAVNAELAKLQADYQRLRSELDAVYATKTMRLFKPAREAYSRIRFRR
jgi:hypothetical protein